MTDSSISFIQKLAEASRLLKEAAKQLDEFGLELDFQITIKAHLPVIDFVGMTDPGEKTPPSK